MWYYVLKNRNAADVESFQNIYPFHFYMQQGDDVLIQPELTRVSGDYIAEEIEGGTFYYLQVPREQYLIPVEGDKKINAGIFNIIPYQQPFKKFVFSTELKPKKKNHPYLWNLYRIRCDEIMNNVAAGNNFFPNDEIGTVLCSLALANSYKITPEVVGLLDLTIQEAHDICTAALGVSAEEVKKN